MRTSRWKFPPSLKLIWPSIAYSYSVIAADTLRDLVTLTFDLLTLVSGHTWRVKWSTPPPSLKILRLYVLELWVLTAPIRYHWQCVCSHCACAVSCDLGGKFFPHIWNSWSRFAYSISTFMALRLRQMELLAKTVYGSVLKITQITSAFNVAVNLLPTLLSQTTISR